MKKWFFLIPVCLLCSCTEADIEGVGPDAARPVTLYFSSPDLGTPTGPTPAGTKAPDEQLPAGATVRIAAYYRNATDGPVASFETTAPTYQATYEVTNSGTLVPCVVDADGKKTTGTGTPLTVRGGLYDFYAVSPARAMQLPGGAVSTYQINNIRHKEDVMTSYLRGFSVSQASNTVSLRTFIRKCALVVFNIEPDGGNAVDIVSLKGKNLTLKGLSTYPAALKVGETYQIPATRGTISASDAQIEFIDTDFEPVDPLPPGSPSDLNKTKGAVLPKQAGPFLVEIQVERDGQIANLSATIDPDSQTAFEAGKRYVFTLKIKNNKGSLFLRVLDWNTHTVNDGGVGTPDSGTPVDPDIIPGVGIPMLVAEWNNINWTGNGSSGGSSYVRIEQSVVDAYKAEHLADSHPFNYYPPFSYDQGVPAGENGVYIENYKGDSNNYQLYAPYKIEVEDTQYNDGWVKHVDATDYCKNKEPKGSWRLPLAIELFAMREKCKGSNNDPTDNEKASFAFGEKLLSMWYWSSSPSGSDKRTIIYFQNYSPGDLIRNGNKTNTGAFRCVREY